MAVKEPQIADFSNGDDTSELKEKKMRRETQKVDVDGEKKVRERVKDRYWAMQPLYVGRKKNER